ncbi:hypothetical protein GQ457_07G010410 [Hibiscus cannabinus]
MGESGRSVWTLFVSNIADQLHWQGVWQVFDRHGEVVDVFIPRRRSRTGERFGFVRMAVQAEAEQVVERLHGRWIYGARISVTFALRGNRDESWRWRKERTARADPSGSQKKYKVVESGDSVTGKDLEPYRRVVGVVVKDKVKVLESCVVAWCRRGLRGKMFVEELQRASIVGCSVMRAAGDSVVLMFSSSDERLPFGIQMCGWIVGVSGYRWWVSQCIYGDGGDPSKGGGGGSNSGLGNRDDGRSEIRVSDLQEDQMTRMNLLYCTSGEDDSGRDGAVRGMVDEFDTVGVVCREVTPEPRLCELELWWQCTEGLRVTKAVDEGAVPRLGWRAPDTVFESVSKSTGKQQLKI